MDCQTHAHNGFARTDDSATMACMDAQVVEVDIRVEGHDDGPPVIDHLNGARYCRLSWPSGAGPPSRRGVYMWLSNDFRVLYVGKATSNSKSHLYRRITAYKRATPGKTQWTSLRINTDILEFTEQGGRIRLLCLVMSDADPDDVTSAEEALINRARPPWNRQGNLHPRAVEDAMKLEEILMIDPERGWPTTVRIPTQGLPD